MNTPWNKTTTRQWTVFDVLDSATYPPEGQNVLAVDMYGNQAVCWFDHRAHDFIYSVEGFDKKELIDLSKSVVAGVISKCGEQMSQKLQKEFDQIFMTCDGKHLDFLYDSIDDLLCKCGPAYFDAVEFWMPLPPIPDMPVNGQIKTDEDVTFLAYDILTAIEPSIRAAIRSALYATPKADDADNADQDAEQ